MKNCRDCDECTYIGDGDFICLKVNPPKVIIVDHVPAINFAWCDKEDK